MSVDELANRLAAEILSRVPRMMEITGEDDIVELVELAFTELAHDLAGETTTVEGVDTTSHFDGEQRSLFRRALMIALTTLRVGTSIIH
jgi:hypothetical protein